ncbi:helix-turn-helix domain-containing protein [Paludibacterium sp.]|uniref:helix-turn-helix domain-containing protein n=1 Tax=Paludibacterium sp. TaxID=1917523 RepID=UPI0025CF211B|nr:helix-turn-helix domain-containing protein [Paludibacterium sp.]MBV8649626.1 helix-turn-helix domain-containing protein [Paludibacterium sp.]
MITGRQISAARALLGWSAIDLARHADLSDQTIRRAEDGETARASTLDRLADVLGQYGVEFIGSTGVNKRIEQIRTIAGNDTFLKIQLDILEKCQGKPGQTADFFFVDNAKSPPVVVETMQKIRAAGILCRYITHEKPKVLHYPVGDYRGAPADLFNNTVSVVYGDYYASMFSDLQGEKAGAIIIASAPVADAQRKIFNLLWASLPRVRVSK